MVGVSSYPHPWLMPKFWEFLTVSMGLSPIMAIYQARFNKYLQDRVSRTRVVSGFGFIGDGECDEPETLGAISLASREGLDNLVFVINCNLQRLDGPVRGNGKIIQELEGVFRGAGWNVIKVIWGEEDALLAKDEQGLLLKRMNEGSMVSTRSTLLPGSYIREHFGDEPELAEMVSHLSDEALKKLRCGGHDPEKVYAAFHSAVHERDMPNRPTVGIAKTIKGYGLGEVGEGRNVTHQQKKLNEEELRAFRSRFGIPISELCGESTVL